jgi:hypothetical protein
VPAILGANDVGDGKTLGDAVLWSVYVFPGVVQIGHTLFGNASEWPENHRWLGITDDSDNVVRLPGLPTTV